MSKTYYVEQLSAEERGVLLMRALYLLFAAAIFWGTAYLIEPRTTVTVTARSLYSEGKDGKIENPTGRALVETYDRDVEAGTVDKQRAAASMPFMPLTALFATWAMTLVLTAIFSNLLLLYVPIGLFMLLCATSSFMLLSSAVSTSGTLWASVSLTAVVEVAIAIAIYVFIFVDTAPMGNVLTRSEYFRRFRRTTW